MGKVLDRLYATDYYAWTLEQAAALRRLASNRADLPLDLDHLAEEVEDLGKTSAVPSAAGCAASSSTS